MKPFGLGLIHDPIPIGVPFPAAGATDASIPEEASHESYAPRILFQFSSDGCVGCAFTTAIELRAAIMGLELEDVSWLGIYTMARLAYDGVLEDKGSRPSGAFDMIERKGIVTEKRWPSNPTMVNEPLPWDVYQHAAAAKVEGIYRCDNLDSVRLAIARGFPVTYDQAVDQAYYDYRSGLYVPGGMFKGMHMQTIIGYAPGKFRVQNSWSPGWGDGGRSWVSDEVVARSYFRYAVPIAPKEIS